MTPRLPRKLKKRLRTDTTFAIHYAVRFVVKAMAQANKYYKAMRTPPNFKPGGIMHTGKQGEEVIIPHSKIRIPHLPHSLLINPTNKSH
jgi:hypothetical protein